MRPVLLAVLGWLVLGGCSTEPGGPPRPLTPGEIAAVDRSVRGEIAAQDLVGVAIGVIRDGRVVYCQGYGQADRATDAPMTAATVVNWASNSKPMAAILAAQLVEAKRLNLDADVRKYVPEFPDHGVVITPRQLLCHQSGLPHYNNGKVVPVRSEDSFRRDLVDPISAIGRFGASPLLFPPGERAEYSSYAYVLLSAVIERVGGEPYDAQVQARIARPLGLRSLQLDHAGSGPNWATGYGKQAGRIVAIPDEANDWKLGAGGYKSNVRDFATWAAALAEGRLISAASERTLWEPQTTSKGERTPFGLGFVVSGQGGRLQVEHNGNQAEIATRMVLYPREHRGVVVMSNSNDADVGRIATAILEALDRKP